MDAGSRGKTPSESVPEGEGGPVPRDRAQRIWALGMGRQGERGEGDLAGALYLGGLAT